jgi:hypothetical protein
MRVWKSITPTQVGRSTMRAIRWTAGDAGPPALRRHRACGAITRIELRCAECGELVTSSDVDVDVEAGPGVAG